MVASGDLIGVTTPRLFTPPLAEGPEGDCGCGCALTEETSKGFAVERFANDILGVDLIPWERWLLIHALELLPTGEFRFRTVVLLVARQNGKSTVLQILSLWMMYVFATPLVIGTAQNLDVAREQWDAAVQIAEGNSDLREQIDRVSRYNGNTFLRLKSGERYKVAAASREGGRGLSGDLVILDEVREHKTWDAWSAVTKTTMAREMAQVWGASNAGDMSSVVLSYLRMQAHEELGYPDGAPDLEAIEPDPDVEALEDDSLGLFEWSAPPGCSVADKDGWRQANPSLGFTITERAIRSAAKTDPEWTFRTEVLCQWMDGSTEGPFPAGSWEACQDTKSQIADDSDISFCLDVSWDRTRTYISAGGYRDDGRKHGEVIEAGVGTDWVVDWITAPEDKDGNPVDRKGIPVVVQAKRAPASSLIRDLEDAGVTVVEWDGVSGTAELYDAVRAAHDGEPRFAHLGQPALNVAAANAATRPVGDAWAWDRRKSPVDAAPLVAVTGALWGLTPQPTKTPTVHAWPEEAEDEDRLVPA